MKPWFWQLLLLVVIWLVAWFGIRLMLTTIREEMDSVQKSSVLREHREKQLARLPELEKQHALIEGKVRELSIILDKERLVTFIEDLEVIALKHGVQIEMQSKDNAFLESKTTLVEKKDGKPAGAVSKETDDTDVLKRGTMKETGIMTELPLKKFLKLTILLTGSYQSITQYLYELERMPYALDVISLHLKEHNSDGDSVVSGSGALNPFTELPVVISPKQERSSLENRLDATFETVVYMRE